MIKIRFWIYIIVSYLLAIIIGKDVGIHFMLVLIVFLLLEVIEINDKIK